MIHTVISKDLQGRTYNVPVDKLEWRPSAYGIVINDGKILLTKQFGKYGLPGGAIELGEDPKETVVREVFEETGYRVSDPLSVDALTTFFSWKEGEREWHFHSILLFYVCRLEGGVPSVENAEEDEAAFIELPEWVDLDGLEKLELGSTFDWQSIVRRVAREGDAGDWPGQRQSLVQ